MKEKNLTIVIVTFESAGIINFCLNKINLQKYDVILVDNNSSDRTVEIAKEFLPESNIIKLKNNSGFGRANNVGLKKVETDYALVLNPDAFIEEEDIEKVLSFLETDPKTAIAGAIPYNCAINEEGIITKSEQPVLVSFGTATKETSEIYYTRFITGASMFLRMSVFRKIGFFDEEFFLYCEDNEICKRVLKNGYKNALLKNTKFFHCSQKSSKESRNEKVLWHRLGWSKSYYITATNGVIVGKLVSLRILLKYLFLLFQDLLKKNPSKRNKYAMQGAFAYLIGQKAFDKNGNPRFPN